MVICSIYLNILKTKLPKQMVFAILIASFEQVADIPKVTKNICELNLGTYLDDMASKLIFTMGQSEC